MSKTDKRCKVLSCTNSQGEGSFNGDFCSPCYSFLVLGKGTNCAAVRQSLNIVAGPLLQSLYLLKINMTEVLQDIDEVIDLLEKK
jgi:hypothetical protein